jgi:hypothetical protein
MSAEEAAKCGRRDEMEERRSLSLKEVLDSWHGK